ncbi:MAG: hypothetical protein [Olavius algarvensis Gamma 1 endosymbiont]|nr:MAG: hypothetical protein [Olavius algarvensis Gamma 1 endosymbiont]
MHRGNSPGRARITSHPNAALRRFEDKRREKASRSNGFVYEHRGVVMDSP